MNKIFKVIFNRTTQKMEVVSELARSQGKAASSTDERGTIKLAAAGILGGATLLIGGMATFMLSATPAEAAVIIDSIENKNKDSSAVVNNIVIHTNASVPTNSATNPYNYFNPGSLSYANRTELQASGNVNKNGTDSRLLYKSNTTSAIVIGHHATALEDGRSKNVASGVAIGDYSHAGGGLSIAIGPFSRTASIGSVALGTSARAEGFNSFAAMRQSAAIADYSTAIGSASWANATASFAIGASATALGNRSFAIGSGTPQTVNGSQGFENRRSIYDGQNNTLAFGTDAFSIGTKAKTNGNHSFAIGTNAWSGGFKLEKHKIKELGNVFNPNTAKVANNAFALGTNTRANSNDTVAFSTNANATGGGSIAFGVNSNTTGIGAIAFGNASKAWKDNAISIGWNATSHAQKVISIGSHSNASKYGAMAIGDTANSSGNNSVAIGYSANVSDANATAVGTRANITHEGGTAIGFKAKSKGNYATAIAYNSTAKGKNSIAAGVNSTVLGTHAAALGYNNTVLDKDTFVLGSNVTVDTKGSVILGSDSTKATATKEDTAKVGNLTYSGFAGGGKVVAGDYVSIGNITNARQIKFVAPGNISANSTDAINGSQLYATNDMINNVTTSIKENFGGNAIVNPNGTITYTNIGGTGKDNINDAIKAAKTKVKAGTNVNVTSKKGTDRETIYTVNANHTTVSTAVGNKYVSVAEQTKGNNVTNYEVSLTSDAITDFTKDTSSTVKGGSEYVNVTSAVNATNANITDYTVDISESTKNTITNNTNNIATNTQNIANHTAAINKGFGLQAQDGGNVNKKLGEFVEVVGGNNNINTTVADGKVKINLNNTLDLTNSGSVTIGDTKVDGNGLTITGGPNVTKNGIDAGSKKITNVADGEVSDTSKEAVNGSQLHATHQNVTNVSNNVTKLDEFVKKGFNITADVGTEDNVQLGQTVTYTSTDKNIITTVSDNKIDFGLNNTLTLGTPGKDGQPGKDGSIGVNGKDGSAVVLNGKDGSIGLNGKDGLTFKSADGAQGVDGTNGKDGLPGKDGKTRIVYQPTNPDGTPKGDPETVATLNDGLIFTGNNELLNRHKLNTVVKIVGEGVDKATSEAFKSAAGNINVVANEKDQLEIRLNREIKDLSNATFVEYKKDANGNDVINADAPKTVVNNNGVTITPKDGKDGKDGNVVSLTKDGLNNGGNQIVNVKSGIDGVNGQPGKDGKAVESVNDLTDEQLDKVGSNAANIKDVRNATDALTSKGFNITADHSALAKDEKVDNVNLGETVNYTSKDNNIITTVSDNAIDFALNNNLTIGGPGKDGKDGVDGKVGVKGADGTAGVTLNGKDGSIGLTGPKGQDGKDGASATISVKDGAKGLDGNDGKDGESKTRIVYEKPDGTTEEVATLNDGLRFVGDDGKEIVKKLNETLKISGGDTDLTNLSDNNIGVVNNNGALTVKLAKDIDLTKDGSVTIGDTTVNNDGLTIKDGPSVTKAGINAGDKKITNVQDGEISATSKDAVNGSQLYQVQEVANAGWNLTANGKDKGNVKPGATVDLNNKDGNIILTKEGNNVTFGLNNNLTIGGKDGKDGQIGIAGKDGKDGVTIKGDGTITAGRDGKDGVDGSIGATGKDGASVVLNGKDGSIGLTGPKGQDGKPGASANIAVKDGAEGVDGTNGKDGLPGENGKTRIVYETKDKDGKTVTEQVATLNDGLIFSGNNEDVKNRQKLNTEVKVKGEGVDKTASENFKSASGNINVKANGTDTLEVQLAKAIDLTEDGSVTTGDTTVNNNGLTIKDGPSVTKGGIDAKGTKITNVKDGDVTATSKDAVSGSQLYNAMQNTGWYLTVDGNVAETSEKGAQRVNNNGKVAVSGGKNIVVSRKGSTVEVATSSNPEFDSVKVGGTTISSTVAKDGVNELNIVGSKNAQTRITNVAPGVKGTDAVNVNQLKGAENRLNNRISNVDKDLRAGIAGALAAGNLYHVTQPGKSMVSAGVGAYRGQGAIAVGYSRLSDNGKVGIKFSVNSNSRGDTGAAASVGYQW
ncbi:Hep_Hag [Mannheimia haemolytica]|uniref:YadA-like family protein n=1 Tax=Mannheimia haemolytica TaxID=75985 RepID=UPI000DA3B38E|nr:YadA-like family protein [Mannheimia haemolytica]SQE29942.1 Hep_Hag [Mannheimia haemolytica]